MTDQKECVVNRFLISCIVPVFNGERYLRETLDSILAQTYRSIEVIVADDGSTDDTARVVESYGQTIRYIKQDNAGASAARNLGLSAARGEFVAFLDADDLWHPEKLARQMAFFDACPGLGLSVTYQQNFWIPQLIREEEHYRDHKLSKAMPGYHSGTLLARSTVFATIGQFDPALPHADKTEWFLRALEKGIVIKVVPEILMYRRLHESNLSRTAGAESREEYLKLLKITLDRRRQNKASA